MRPDDLSFAVRLWRAGRLSGEQFADACARRAERPDAPLTRILAESGWLTDEDLERFRDETPPGEPFRDALAALADPSQSLPPEATTDHVPVFLDGKRYELLGEVGRGGMGVVLLARDHLMKRDVALKELAPDRRDDGTSRLRLLNEARITGRLQHPGVVPVYDLFDDGGRTFYTMKYVQGETYRKAIDAFHNGKRRDAAGSRALLAAFASLCRTMAFAHSRGVVHRDLKPANVVLGGYAEVMVLDWGLAKEVGSGDEPAVGAPSAEPGLTATGQVMGTPAYLSPEQAAGGEVGPASDVYGLGAILYHVLTGRPPVEAKNTPEALEAVRTKEPKPPASHWPAVPRSLQAVCQKALRKRPEDRYASADELAADVQRFLDDEAVSVRRDPIATRLVRLAKKHRTAFAGLSALTLTAVVALAVGLYVVSDKEGQRRKSEAKAIGNAFKAAESERKAKAALRKAMDAIDATQTRLGEGELNDLPGLQPVRKALLDSAVANLEELLAVWSDEEEVRAAAARAGHSAARAAYQLGEDARALELIRVAIARQQELLKDHPRNLEYAFDLALMYEWEMVMLIRTGPGQMGDAVERADALIASLSQAKGDAKDQARAASLCGRLENQAAVYDLHRGSATTIGRHTRAIAHIDRAIALDPDNLDQRLTLGGACTTAAVRLHHLLSVPQRLKLLDRAVAALDGLPPRLRQHANALQQRGNAANARYLAHADDGRPEDGEASLEEAVELRTRLVRENPRGMTYRMELASARCNLAGLRERQRRNDDALALYRLVARDGDEVLALMPNAADRARPALLGYAGSFALCRRTGRTAEAGEALLRLHRLGVGDPKTYRLLYEVGRDCALLAAKEPGDGKVAELAVDLLAAALERGFDDAERFRREVPLGWVAAQPRGKAVLAKMKAE